MTEIHAGTWHQYELDKQKEECLLDIGAIVIGAKRVKDLKIKDKAKDENTST